MKKNQSFLKKYGLLIGIGVVVFCCVCSIGGYAISQYMPDLSSAPEIVDVVQATTPPPFYVTPESQEPAAGPTNTSAPPQPTNTPQPTATFTPAPEPVVLQGSGDSVVDIPSIFIDGGIFHAVYNGSSNFVIWGYDANGDAVDLYVNTIGAYNGKRLFNQMIGDEATRFQVQASGAWTITIYPIALEYVTVATMPGEIQGVGDDVIFIEGSGSTITANATGQSNFAVWSYGTSGRDLLFNEIAPYSGTAILPGGTYCLEITAEGNWTLTIN